MVAHEPQRTSECVWGKQNIHGAGLTPFILGTVSELQFKLLF